MFKDQEVETAVRTIKTYGSLFINSLSEVKTQKERKDDKKSLDFYHLQLISLEDMSINGTRMVSENHTNDGTESRWKDLSPTTVKALLKRAENLGVLPEVTGWRIAKVEYKKPYVINGKDVYLDTIVYPEDKLEAVLLKRLQDIGIVQKQVAPLTVEETQIS